MSQIVDVRDDYHNHAPHYDESGPILSGNTISISVPAPYPTYVPCPPDGVHHVKIDGNANRIVSQGSLADTQVEIMPPKSRTSAVNANGHVSHHSEDVVVVSNPLNAYYGTVPTPYEPGMPPTQPKIPAMTPRRKLAFGNVISELRTAQVVMSKFEIGNPSYADKKPILHSVSSTVSQLSEDDGPTTVDFPAPPPFPPALPPRDTIRSCLAENGTDVTLGRSLEHVVGTKEGEQVFSQSDSDCISKALEDSGFQFDVSTTDIAGTQEGVIHRRDSFANGQFSEAERVKEKDKEPKSHRPLEHLHSTPVRGRRVAAHQMDSDPSLSSVSGADRQHQQQQEQPLLGRDPLSSDSSNNSEVNVMVAPLRDRTESYQDTRSSVSRGSLVKELQEQLKPVIDPALMRIQQQQLLQPVPKEYVKGPDQVIPTDAFTTVEPSGAVKLKIDERGLGSIPPISVPTLLQRAVMRHMDRPALCVKRNDQWVTWTYKQYLHDVQMVAKAFIRLGLERFRSVCILGFNSPEWFIADLAAIHAGGFAVGVYTTNSPEACLHCFADSQASIIVVENRQQLEKVLKVRDKIPTLRAIVQYTGKPEVEGVISWSQLLNLGNATADHVLEDRLKRSAVNQCCTIIYTSGTTGLAKGVMLSHDNLTWNSHASSTYMGCSDGRDTFISYLPLSHVAAQITELYIPLSCGGVVYFANSDALKGSLINTLREVRPTHFLGVPRVWEKMYEKMLEVGQGSKGLKKVIAKWAKGRGLLHAKRRMQGRRSTPLGFALARALVFSKVRKALGFDRTRNVLSGAAPLSHEVAEYFASLNLVILDAYGLSESTGPHTINVENFFRMGSVGKTAPGLRTNIRNPDPDGNGEILMGGRDVFMGYVHDELHTAEVIDGEGWFATGDVGHMDEYGFVYITGRLKEIIITAGGENVAPVLIEDNIRAELPCVSQCVVVGDKRKFLAVLLTLKTEIDPVTQDPLPALSSTAKHWFLQAGLPVAETVQDVLCNLKQSAIVEAPRVVVTSPGASLLQESAHNLSQATAVENSSLYQAIQAGIDRANTKATSNAQRVQKWSILPADLSQNGGELGPTMKLKRHFVMKKYADYVEAFYVA